MRADIKSMDSQKMGTLPETVPATFVVSQTGVVLGRDQDSDFSAEYMNRNGDYGFNINPNRGEFERYDREGSFSVASIPQEHILRDAGGCSWGTETTEICVVTKGSVQRLVSFDSGASGTPSTKYITPVTERGISGPIVSPDGRDVLFTSDLGSQTGLFLVPAAGGSPRQLKDLADGGLIEWLYWD